MPAYFDHGMMAFTPAWHGMGNVLDYWPGSWNDAAEAAGLDWDVESVPIYVADCTTAPWGTVSWPIKTPVQGFYGVQRTDTKEILAVNKDSRVSISNAEFGNIIEYVMGSDLGRELKFETLISIRGGRIVVATLYLDNPYEIPGDPSPFKRYVTFYTRHDIGGLRCGPTNVRVVCANTQAAADNEMNRHKVSWSIRHTSNWSERVNDVRDALQAALRTDEEWLLMAKELAATSTTNNQVADFLDKWLPLSTDMSSIQLERVRARRHDFLRIYHNSATTEGIRGTKWGVLQTAIEMCDHHFTVRSVDAHVDRVLLSGDNRKARAYKLVGAL